MVQRSSVYAKCGSVGEKLRSGNRANIEEGGLYLRDRGASSISATGGGFEGYANEDQEVEELNENFADSY